MNLDNQDIINLAMAFEEDVGISANQEGYENLINFFALKHYLTYLTNNKGAIKRIVFVTRMIEKLIPEVSTFVTNKLRELPSNSSLSNEIGEKNDS